MSIGSVRKQTRVHWIKYIASFLLLICCCYPVRSYAEQWKVWYDFGVYAFDAKDYTISKDYFLKSLKQNPDNECCFHYLGKISCVTNRYDDAKVWFEKAWEQNRALPGLAFDLAMLHFKLESYQQSFELFNGIVSEHPDRVLARYYAGMCLYRQQEFSAAISYLLAAADQNPSIQPSCFYYAGVCYKNLNMPGPAREKFEYVQHHAKSPLLIDNAIQQLALLKKIEQFRKSYTLSIQTGVGYEDNVASAPDTTGFYSDQGDTVADVYLSGNYTITNQYPYRLGAGVSHYQSMHKALTEYDISATVLTLYAFRFFHQFGLGLTYVPSFYSLDKDSFLTRHTMGVTALYGITTRLLVTCSSDYTDNSYDDAREKNGTSREGTLGFHYTPNGTITDLSSSIGYETTSTSGPDYSFCRIKTRIRVSFALPWDMNCDITGHYELKDYDNDNSYYETKREDKWFASEVSISKPVLDNWMSISAEFRHEDNASTIDPFDYRKNSVAVFLTAQF